MRTSPEKPAQQQQPPTHDDHEIDLDLPAMDGEEETPVEAEHDALDDIDDGGNALDDATGESDPIEEIAVEGAEGGWLVDSENAGTLDVGPFDVVIEPEGKILGDDEGDHSGHADDLIAVGDEAVVADSGEEGPTDEDEELREEDLPALDADEDGDVGDDELFERGMLGTDEDLRWDDRAWSRSTDVVVVPSSDEAEDSGVLAVPGDDATQSPRDAMWKQLDESGRIMAATFMPGGSVVVALRSSDHSRAFIVRIQADGEARIIAEIDPGATGLIGAGVDGAVTKNDRDDDEEPPCIVTFLRWDATRGCLFVGGNFGVEAYSPLLQ